MLGVRSPSPASSTTAAGANWVSSGALAVGDDRAERDPVEEVLEPATARQREPWGADRERSHAKAGVGQEEQAAGLHDRELLFELDVEAVKRPGAVREQLVELAGGDRRGRAYVAVALADQHDLDPSERVGERVEDHEPGPCRRVHRALAGAGGHQRDPPGAGRGEPGRRGRARRFRQLETQLLMGNVAGQRRADEGPGARRGQQPIAREVVVAQSREHRELDVLRATEVVEDPVPAAGNAGLPGRRVRAGLEQRMLDRVRVRDERAQPDQLDRGGRFQHERDLTGGVGQVMPEAVMERLDRVPDRMGVEPVDQ